MSRKTGRARKQSNIEVPYYLDYHEMLDRYRDIDVIAILTPTGYHARHVMGTVRVRWKRDRAYYARDAWRGTWELDGGVMAQQDRGGGHRRRALQVRIRCPGRL